MASKTLLIVDDEPVITEISKRKLENLGYKVVTAANGEEALHALGAHSFDLIVLDIEMPKMNGYSFLIEKSKNMIWKDIPLIVLTAYNEMEPIFRRHQVVDYILKPFHLEYLIVKIVQAVGPGKDSIQVKEGEK